MNEWKLLEDISAWILEPAVNSEKTGLESLRKRVFNTILNAGILIGWIAALVTALPFIQDENWLFAALIGLMYGLLLVLRFGIKTERHQLRASLFLLMIFIMGFATTLSKTLNGDGRIWMLVGPVAAAVILNIRAAYSLLGINLICWTGIYYLITSPSLGFEQSSYYAIIFQEGFLPWLGSGLILFLVDFVLITSILAVFHTLDTSLHQSRTLVEKLQIKEKDRSQAEKALSVSETRYRKLIDNSPYLIMELGPDFEVFHINPAMRRSLELDDKPPEEIHLADILPEDLYQSRFEKLKEAFETNQLVEFIDHGGGKTFDNVFVPSEDLKSVQLIAMDITENEQVRKELLTYQQELEERVEERTRELELQMIEREQAENTARAAQRLADIGLLTTGVAHELNSPLQAILSNTEMAQLRLQKGEVVDPASLESTLQNIRSDVLRCSNIVRSLQSYAHQPASNLQPTELGELIPATLDKIAHEFSGRSDIHIISRVQKDIPSLCCEPDQIQRVLINLLINARDALPEGGEIRLTVDFNRAKNQFSIQVQDNGIGIPADLKNEIFKPFFTTKDVGKGTGLGLYLVSGIIEAHGGEISFSTSPGEGTTFLVLLPESPPDLSPPRIKGRYGTLI